MRVLNGDDSGFRDNFYWKFTVIECFEQEGKKMSIGEVTEKQRRLYEAFGIIPPA